MTSLVSLQQGNVKKYKKMTKIVNIEEENLRVFWTCRGISMKFSRKMWLNDNIKSHEKPGLHPFSEKHMFGKTTGEGRGQFDPAFLGLNISQISWENTCVEVSF